MNRQISNSGELQYYLDQDGLIDTLLEEAVNTNDESFMQEIMHQASCAINMSLSKSEYQKSQGILERVFNAITGKNLNIIADTNQQFVFLVKVLFAYSKYMASSTTKVAEVVLQLNEKVQILFERSISEGILTPESEKLCIEQMPVERLIKMATAGNSHAKFILAQKYHTGQDIPHDPQVAYLYAAEAVKEGIEEARQVMIDYQYTIRKNIGSAFKIANKGYLSKDPVSTGWLGKFYYYGEGCKKNLGKAEKCFHAAIKLGCSKPFVYAHYGTLLADSENPKKDYNKAISYLEQADKLKYDGHDIFSILFFLYQETNAIDKEIKLFSVSKRGHEKGFAKSTYCLAKCFEIGIGVKQNTGKALEYLKICNDLGLPEAKAKYPETLYRHAYSMYYGAHFSKKDSETGLELLKEASELSCSDASSLIARHCLVNHDFDGALNYALVAKSQGTLKLTLRELMINDIAQSLTNEIWFYNKERLKDALKIATNVVKLEKELCRLTKAQRSHPILQASELQQDILLYWCDNILGFWERSFALTSEGLFSSSLTIPYCHIHTIRISRLGPVINDSTIILEARRSSIKTICNLLAILTHLCEGNTKET
jgi:TPR repeat protein